MCPVGSHVPLLQSELLAHPHVSFARHAAPAPDALQCCRFEDVQSPHDFVTASHALPLGQSESARQATQPCAVVLVSQTLFVPVQSAPVSHACPMHVPTPPSPDAQKSPAGQFAAPDPRQPATQAPAVPCAVSQYVPFAQSASAEQPHAPFEVWQSGCAASATQRAASVAEHSVHCPVSVPASPV
jgi:hypothetical protein